jgi:flavin-dependent dehydrogenase
MDDQNFMSQHYDYLVAVIGGGPAGALTARSLAQQGIAVVLLDQSDPAQPRNHFSIGEGLPPAAQEIMQTLGIWEDFVTAGHQPAYGNCSAWGSATLVDNDFLRHPYGRGWHLDRARFDSELRQLAVQAGVQLLQPAKVTGCRATAIGFTIDYHDPRVPSSQRSFPSATLKVRAVVDATGRASKIAQSLGATKIVDDRLMGFAQCWPTNDQDSRTLVEAVAEGWWYTALLPQQQRLAIYFTDPDLPAAKLARSITGWRQLLALTTHLSAIAGDFSNKVANGSANSLRENQLAVSINSNRSQFADALVVDKERSLAPRSLAAGSARLLPPSNPSGWLAVGDAAAAFDPLSSQGIVCAMEGASRAASTLANYFHHNNKDFTAYNRWLTTLYFNYRHNYMVYYQLERRWPNSIFWQRRQ